MRIILFFFKKKKNNYYICIYKRENNKIKRDGTGKEGAGREGEVVLAVRVASLSDGVWQGCVCAPRIGGTHVSIRVNHTQKGKRHSK